MASEARNEGNTEQVAEDRVAPEEGHDRPRGGGRRRRRRRRRAPPPETFSVYVIRLDHKVMETPRFRAANPQYVEGKPCVYVGMTGLSPEERLKNHRAGVKANRYAKEYGRYLMWRQFKRLNPMTWAKAKKKEVELAEKLRKKGWAVWQN